MTSVRKVSVCVLQGALGPILVGSLLGSDGYESTPKVAVDSRCEVQCHGLKILALDYTLQ